MGQRRVYQAGCQARGISKATLLQKIKQVSYKPPRKQRVDYGDSALTVRKPSADIRRDDGLASQERQTP
ncbi:MAG: hypothetical protein ACTXOO_00580 [Sodalis sp. (in: enterobacteria)]